MPAISTEQVRAQVHKFWNVFSSRSGPALEAMYFPSAIIFSAFNKRSEPARLMLMRKVREFKDPLKTSVNAKLGTIDVLVLGDVAIASYFYDFHLIKTKADGSRISLEAPFSCATQIFQLDDRGELRILHEHFGATDIPKKTVLAPDSSPSPAQLLPAMNTGMQSISGAPARIASPAAAAAVSPITTEQVRAEVEKYWNYYSRRAKAEFEGMFLPTAIVFTAGERRSEPARLAITRRTRESMSPTSSVSAKLGAIDVQVASADVAIASYPYNAQHIKIFPNGKRILIEVPFARHTLVFQRDESGALRICHEHGSASEKGTSKELPAQEPAIAGK
jgi:ketosteroid isomerase-like protein